MRRVSKVFAITHLALLVATPTIGGTNASATAGLTWQLDASVTDLDSVPYGRFPLYLQLRGATDIAQLAATIRWTPADEPAHSYRLLPDSSSLNGCGWTTDNPPGGPFAGDSYAWTIRFPPGSTRAAVVFWLTATDSVHPPATFCLASVLATDYEGNLDTLRVTDNATILGGQDAPCPLQLTSVAPRGVLRGENATLHFTGVAFDQGMTVTISTPAATIPVSSLAILSPSQADAVVPIPADAVGPLSVDITDPHGGFLVPGHPAVAVYSPADTDTVLVAVSSSSASSLCYSGRSSDFDETTSCSHILYTCALTHCPSYLFHAPLCTREAALPNPNTLDWTFTFTDWRGRPLAGDSVHTTYTAQPLTGGHCHDGARPAFFQFQDGTYTRLDADDKITDATGACHYHVVVPEVSGAIRAKAVLLNAPGHPRDSQPSHVLYAYVRIPGLVDLHDYHLAQSATADPDHPQNSFVNPRIIPKLSQFFLDLNAAQLPGDDELSSLDDNPAPAAVDLATAVTRAWLLWGIQIDDASLPYGGVFDSNHTWLAPYCFHRYGYSVDLRPKDRRRAYVLRTLLMSMILPLDWDEHDAIMDDLPRFHLEWRAD